MKFAEWINRKFEEPEGQLFKDNKWRIWFPLEIILQVAVSIVTFMILPISVGFIVLLCSAILIWVTAGIMHYTHSENGKMNNYVAIFASLALVAVVAHLTYVLYVQSHVSVLRAAEARYEAEMAIYDKRLGEDRQRMLDSKKMEIELEKLEAEKARHARDQARFEAKTAYYTGHVASTVSQEATTRRNNGPEIQITQYSKPEKPKVEPSAEFMVRHDANVRYAAMGELLIPVFGLIYILIASTIINKETHQSNGGGKRPITLPGSTNIGFATGMKDENLPPKI